jgi:predicted  nucleic acid-binding Zn ribbon protein
MKSDKIKELIKSEICDKHCSDKFCEFCILNSFSTLITITQIEKSQVLKEKQDYRIRDITCPKCKKPLEWDASQSHKDSFYFYCNPCNYSIRKVIK